MAVTHGHGNPDWTRDETLLALGLYFELGGSVPDSSDARIRELSACLRKIPYHSPAARRPSFRNPDGVSFKLQNLRQLATGRGLSNVSKVDRQIWKEYGARPDEAIRAAQKLKQAMLALEVLDPADGDDDEFAEGRLITALHYRRERDSRVRKRLLSSRKKSGKLRCDICNQSSRVATDAYHDAVFEAHHTVPLSSSGERITRLADVALLCANCHRLLHRAIKVEGRWISIQEARGMFAPTPSIAVGENS